MKLIEKIICGLILILLFLLWPVALFVFIGFVFCFSCSLDKLEG